MPQSRKRPGHQYHKPADIPAKQRVKGRITWALLFGVFGLLMALFASGNFIVWVIAAVVAAAIGYAAGKSMEQQSTHK